MTHLEALVGLNKVCDIGSVRLEKLLDYFDKLEDIFGASEDKLIAVSGIGPKIAKQIRSLKKEDIDKEIDLAQKQNLKLITIKGGDYPQNLKTIPGAPIVLYLKGELKEEDRFSLAIVGSRRASFYGLSIAEKFSAELSRYHLTIISGMARGIDTYAHRGALKVGGRTIAVLGSGFNYIYPSENKELLEEISQNGAVISEFPLDTKPLPQNFPRRNRIISGFSLGVLVIEAARNSGALITADFALEQGRDVFALPGKIDSRTSFGTHELIKQGAKLVSSVEDILEELNLYTAAQDESPSLDKAEGKARPRIQKNRLSKEESLLYNLISNEYISLDEIVEKSNLNVSAISDTLLKLEMKRLIRQAPGKQFTKVTHE